MVFYFIYDVKCLIMMMKMMMMIMLVSSYSLNKTAINFDSQLRVRKVRS